MAVENGTVRGTVKWFNAAKGYGFAIIPGVGEDVFLHYSQIQATGYKTLLEGQTIECILVDGPKGKMGHNITVIP